MQVVQPLLLLLAYHAPRAPRRVGHIAASLSRREACAAAATSAAATLASGLPAPAHASFDGAEWRLWPALPLAPYSRRKTLMHELVPGTVWSFEQLLGVFYVHVPIRMNVIAMEQGGLFVYAPVAPTRECLDMLAPLIEAHGPVKHIILPSVAPEHKVLAGPFAREFPAAQLWTTDAQYSFPLNLPPTWLGLPSGVKTLPPSSEGGAMWGGEFDHAVLSAKASASSIYQDAAFYHKPSRTLLVCDAVQSIGATPPEILLSEPEYRRALLYHARDDPLEKVADEPATWRKGWERIALFANFFEPATLVKLPDEQWLSAAPKTPMPELGWAGVLPFTWTSKAPAAFAALRDDGRPVVAPIIQIILARQPDAARAWVSTLCSWDFQRVVTAHFDAPIQAGPAELRRTFAFLTAEGDAQGRGRFCDADAEFLREKLAGLPDDLALYPSALGPLRGMQCDL